jgi:hypothetical protein
MDKSKVGTLATLVAGGMLAGAGLIWMLDKGIERTTFVGSNGKYIQKKAEAEIGERVTLLGKKYILIPHKAHSGDYMIGMIEDTLGRHVDFSEEIVAATKQANGFNPSPGADPVIIPDRTYLIPRLISERAR